MNRNAGWTERIPLTPEATVSEIARRARGLAQEKDGRVIVGIAGGPGVGKSTTAEALVALLNTQHPNMAALLPMDGFHRKHADLVEAGLDTMKGRPETFDAVGFIALLKQVSTAKTEVMVPGYSREIEDVVEAAHSIPGDASIVVTEGNYLLLDEPEWQGVRPLLDLAVFLTLPRDMVHERLVKRRGEHGLFEADNIVPHVDNVDMPNYDAVNASLGRADLVFDLITDA